MVWEDCPDADEICRIGELRLTTPTRTAVDLARRFREDVAVAAIDALARATSLTVADIELAAQRHPGQRGIRQARRSIALVDPKAGSPRETALRLLIVRAGFPLPESQHPIYNEYGILIGIVDFAWTELTIAVEYEGRHHSDPEQIRRDIARIEEIVEMGWLVIRVTSRDHPARLATSGRRARRRRAARRRAAGG